MSKIIIITSLFSLLFTECYRYWEDDTHNYHVAFYNRSNKDVYIGVLYYPDSIYDGTKKSPYHYDCPGKVMALRNDNNILLSSVTYEGIFMKHQYMYIFIFDANILEQTGQYDSAFLQRIQLNLNDLRERNWCISYPYTLPIYENNFDM